MAICNLFKTLTNNTGTFLTFSQYAEDLTKQQAHGYKYKVTPSKFIACNIDYSILGIAPNTSVPKLLQDWFENGCAIGRKQADWSPGKSGNIFWNCLIHNKLFTITDGCLNEALFIGDINMVTHEVNDGIGYNELYIYLSNNDAQQQVKCTYFEPGDGFESGSELEGRPGKNVKATYWSDNNFEITGTSVIDSPKFDINTIIVLYDILSMDEKGDYKVLYNNIPMGIYFPGVFEGTKMTNIITKYVSNNDIYGSGTSYGIRICSRYVATSFEDTINTTIVSSEGLDTMSQLMAMMGENLQMMREITKSDSSDLSTVGALKETYNMFQNHKVNVPYIVKLLDGNYWFVNGKNTGIRVPDGTVYNELSEQDILEVIDESDTIYSMELVVYGSDKNGNDTLNLFNINETNDLYISAYLTNKLGSIETMDGLEVNGVEVPANKNDKILTYKLPTANTTYLVRGIVKMDGKTRYIPEEPALISAKLHHPIYYGIVNDNVIGNNKYNELNSFISPSIYNRVKFVAGTYVAGAGNKIVYCVPMSLDGVQNGLAHIINRSSMDDIIDDFIVKETIINGQQYIVYQTENNISKDITDITLDFTNILKVIERENI